MYKRNFGGNRKKNFAAYGVIVVILQQKNFPTQFTYLWIPKKM